MHMDIKDDSVLQFNRGSIQQLLCISLHSTLGMLQTLKADATVTSEFPAVLFPL